MEKEKIVLFYILVVIFALVVIYTTPNDRPKGTIDIKGNVKEVSK